MDRFMRWVGCLREEEVGGEGREMKWQVWGGA